MTNTLLTATVACLAVLSTAGAQDAPTQPAAAAAPAVAPAAPTFDTAASDVSTRLKESLAELTALREQIANETIPLNRKLTELENELIAVRNEYQQVSRLLDTRTLDLNNLRTEIKARHDEGSYLSNLFSEFIRNFESRLHIAELQRYRQPLDQAKLAPENSNLTPMQVYTAQSAMLSVALDRLEESLAGARFSGTAVDAGGLVKPGTFVLVGPAALFRAEDGSVVGTAEQRLGSLEPTVIAFQEPLTARTATNLVNNSTGHFPLDPTLGNAHKIEATKETLVEHFKKGGPVMVPIVALAGAALLVALFKWVAISLVRSPSRRRIDALLRAVAKRDHAAAAKEAKAIGGPTGKMLVAGVEHINEPQELIEEVMHETVMVTRLKLHRWLPFIAVTTSSAPLLGLLGTVTGIMNTFTLMTVFGTGDVKTLSSGISEALITTESGLYVAIPSLLIYALLSRKARAVLDQMDRAGIEFLNQINKARHQAPPASTPAAPPPKPPTPEPDTTPQPVAAGAPATA